MIEIWFFWYNILLGFDPMTITRIYVGPDKRYWPCFAFWLTNVGVFFKHVYDFLFSINGVKSWKQAWPQTFAQLKPSLPCPKCCVPPSYPGSPDPCMLVQWSLTGYEHSLARYVHIALAPLARLPGPTGPLRCSTRIFTMYNAHIPKAWRPFTDFHRYSLPDISAEKKWSQFSPWLPPLRKRPCRGFTN